MGSTIILLFAGFVTSLLLIANKNFNSELEVLSSTGIQSRVIGHNERILIDQWAAENNIPVPVDMNKFKFILENYPSRPWKQL